MSKGVKRLIIILIVLVAVLVAADFGAAAAAEYQVSKKMRSELSLADDPSVDIHGFPFLTQALAGDYKDISVMATGVPVKDTMRDLEIDADLRHVRVSLGDLLSGNVSSIHIDEVDGQVQVKASDVGRLLNIPDLSISPQPLDTIKGIGASDAQQRADAHNAGNSSNGQPLSTSAGIELDGTINVAGQKTKVSAYGVIRVSGGNIVIQPTKVELSNSIVSGPLADTIEQQLLPKFAFTLNPRQLPLPLQVQATGVSVIDGALLVQGVAQNVVLNSSSMPASS